MTEQPPLSYLHQATRDIAIRAHGTQMYGDEPYVVHLDAVNSVLLNALHGANLSDIPKELQVAYLHDVIEDTDWTQSTLLDALLTLHTELARLGGTVVRRMLPPEDVVRAVEFCTDMPGPNRRARKQATYARCRPIVERLLRRDVASPPVWLRTAVRVKVADRLANLQNCIRTGNTSLLVMYRSEQSDFFTCYGAPGVCDDLWVACFFACHGIITPEETP